MLVCHIKTVSKVVIITDPQHDKTYKITCVSSEDSNQPGQFWNLRHSQKNQSFCLGQKGQMSVSSRYIFHLTTIVEW